MAFTAEQIKDIRKYMGVPFGFYELTHRLEAMIVLIGTSATDQAQIEVWLTRLAAIDTALTGSDATADYGFLKKVDEVEFYNAEDAASVGALPLTLVAQGRTLIDRIARAMGISDYLPIGDYFGSRRPSGFTISLG